jgi:hypothetical protein
MKYFDDNNEFVISGINIEQMIFTYILSNLPANTTPENYVIQLKDYIDEKQ